MIFRCDFVLWIVCILSADYKSELSLGIFLYLFFKKTGRYGNFHKNNHQMVTEYVSDLEAASSAIEL